MTAPDQNAQAPQRDAARYVLSPEVQLTALSERMPSAAGTLQAGPNDFVIQRPGSRQGIKILSQDLGQFLSAFRRPIGIAHAIVSHSQQTGEDANSLIDEILPRVREFLDEGILVPESFQTRAEAPSQQFPEVRDFSIIRPIQRLEDVEVYLTRTQAGQFAALKINTQTVKGRNAAPALGREAEILKSLSAQGLGSMVPGVIELGTWEGRTFIATEWVSGLPVDIASDTLRRENNFNRHNGLLDLLRRVAAAYSALHQAGVLHGDLHPRNILVRANGTVTIIDFGISATNELGQASYRGGNGYYFEPEYAAAILGKQLAPLLTRSGEIYSLGALLYRLWTGTTYTNFGFDREEVLQQTVVDDPRSFSMLRAMEEPALEAVLLKALHKAPALRFPTVKELELALEAIPKRADVDVKRRDLRVLREFLSGEIENLKAQILIDMATKPPLSSVNMGLAGVAYGVMRIACSFKSGELLAQADQLAEYASTLQSRREAFYDSGLMNESLYGRQSVFNASPGVSYVRALIAICRADLPVAESAVEDFLRESRGIDKLDITFGRAGTLIACANLYSAGRILNHSVIGKVKFFGSELESQLQDEMDALQRASPGVIQGFLGMAHGWAGYLYAVIRWRIALLKPLPEKIIYYLDLLTRLQEPIGRGAHWPRNTAEPNWGYLSGWCNGAAGFLQLWLAAYELTGDAAYLDLAEKSAWTTWDSAESSVDLCCGSAGRAYALLRHFEATEKSEWYDRGIILAERAVAGSQSLNGTWIGLFKGKIALTALASDVVNSYSFSMPFLGAEP